MQNSIHLALTTLLTLTFANLAFAEVVTVEVTIKSVDANDRTITATRKGRTLELDVSKKAEVIIDGKNGELAGLASGQKAKIDYETNLEVITKIVATVLASDPPALVELSELNSGTYTVDPWISPDGLTIYWTFEGTVWTAQRKDTRALFKNKRKLVRGRHATVTADGLTMIMLAPRSDGQKGETLYEAQRSSVEDALSRPREIRELRDEPSPKSPCLSSDGLTLYFTRTRSQRAEFAYAVRKTRSDPWSQSKLLPVDTGGIDGQFTWPFVMSDGLTMLCSVEGRKEAGEAGNLLVLARKSKTAPFENPQSISVEGLAPLTGRAARYVESTRELVFARSVRQKEFSLWMVKNLDLHAIPLVHRSIDPSPDNTDDSMKATADALRVGSIWKGAAKLTLTVLERRGDRFKARFESKGWVREVSGIARDNTISWTGKDVRVIKGSAGGDNEGKMVNDEHGLRIDFVWRGGGKQGTFTLRKQK